MTEEEIRLMQEEMEQYNIYGFGRWSWFAIVEKLANGDITKFDAIYRQNIILALDLLSYWKERDAYRAELMKEKTK